MYCLAPTDAVVDDDNADIVVRVGSNSWGDNDVLVDPSIHRPHGRRSDVIGDVCGAVEILDRYGDGITTTDVKPLRSISAVTDASSLPLNVRTQLAACGVCWLSPTTNSRAPAIFWPGSKPQ